MPFSNSPYDTETTIINGITYEYSAAKTAWIRRQAGVSDITFAGNVTANKVLTTDIRWAGNNAIFNAGITYTASTTPAAAKVGDQWYNTTNDVLYEYITDGVSTYWVDIQSLGTSTGNAVTSSFDDLTLSGNLILTANLLYSIGGDTGRLRHIYAGNVTTVTANVGTINTGNITAGNITLTGAVTATGNIQGTYMLGDGSQLTNLPATGASTGKAIAMAIVFGGYMAAPNIVNVTTIYGRTALVPLSTTLANVVINNAGSGTVVKLNDVMVSNFTTSAITTNVIVGRGASLFYLAGTMSVPANSALMVIAKDTVIYMEEGDFLQANASASSAHLTASYEIIS